MVVEDVGVLKHKLDGISDDNEGFDEMVDLTSFVSLLFKLGCFVSVDFAEEEASVLDIDG